MLFSGILIIPKLNLKQVTIPMKTDDTEIKNISFYSEGLRINAWLHLPGNGKYPAVIGSHGFLSDGTSAKMIALANALNEKGIAFLRIDHRGCGQSEGIFSEVTSLEGRCQDIISGINLLRSHPRLNGKFGIFGSSMGGSTAINAFSRIGAEAIVTLAAPVKGSSIIRRPDDPNPHNLSEDFYETGLKFDISEQITNLGNCLVFHGDSDQVVPCSNAHEIMAGAGDPKKIIIFENGDHRITDVRQQKKLVDEAVKWFESCL